MMEDFSVFVEELRRLSAKAREMDNGAIMARWRIGRNLNERYGFPSKGATCGNHYPGCGHIPGSEMTTIIASMNLNSNTLIASMRQFNKVQPIEKNASVFARACGTWTNVVRSLSTNSPEDGINKTADQNIQNLIRGKDARRVPARNRNIICRWMDELSEAGCEDARESLTFVMERIDIVLLWKGMGKP